VMMILLFRSVLTGLVAMIPSLVPIAIGIGSMSYLGIKLNLATSMAFSVAIGMTVDNTIHLVWNIKRHIEMGEDRLTASLNGLKHIIQPALSSSFILMIGFMTFAFSSLWPMTEFGFLIAFCFFLAVLATFFLTPVLFSRLNIIKPKKGKAPSHSVFMDEEGQ